MTSSNGNIIRVTGHLCGEFTGHKGQWCGALMFSLICALKKRLSKQPWRWWFETPSCSLWLYCYVYHSILLIIQHTCQVTLDISGSPIEQSFNVFSDLWCVLCLNKWLSKQLRGWWFEPPLGSLWRHCNVIPYSNSKLVRTCIILTGLKMQRSVYVSSSVIDFQLSGIEPNAFK